MVIVAQRVSTIVNADQILVLEDGEIVGLGTHDELLESCPTYAEIVESQSFRGGGMSDPDPRHEGHEEAEVVRPPHGNATMGPRWGSAGMPTERSKDFGGRSGVFSA